MYTYTLLMTIRDITFVVCFECGRRWPLTHIHDNPCQSDDGPDDSRNLRPRGNQRESPGNWFCSRRPNNGARIKSQYPAHGTLKSPGAPVPVPF